MNTIDYDPKSFRDFFDSELGKEIWAYLNSNEAWVLLKLTSELGHPAVEGIGDQLLTRFGSSVKEDRNKQAIGHMVRPIMEAHDFNLVQKGVKCRMKKEVFTYASRYSKS